MQQKTVLILCTGNSCRSQMAEGMINHFLAGQWRAYSAGTEPSGYVHPLAIAVMQEVEIDLTKHRSKSVEAVRHMPFDLVVTVCDDAAENCPLWLGKEKTVHMGFIDPAKVSGTYQEQMQVFRQVRDEIRSQVLSYLLQKFA